MKPSEFFKKLTGRYLWGNIFAMGAVLAVFVIALQVGINLYTHHGERIAVPNIYKMQYEKAADLIDDLDLEIVVTDTGYIKTLPPGVILEQMPKAGTYVKSGRIIYVTINATSTPTMALPDIIDNSSYREAIARLKGMGFKVGEPQYVPGEKDWVYGVLVNGRNVATGSRIPIEAVLIIQVGNGQRDASDSIYMTDLPRDEYYEDVSSDDGSYENVEPSSSEHTDQGAAAKGEGDDFEVVE